MKMLPFDEIRQFTHEIKKRPRNVEEEDLISTIVGLLILSYKNGIDDANSMIDTDYKRDFEKLMESLNKEYDGKTWEDRVREYYETNDGESIARVIDTEAHRNYNQAIIDIALESGKDVKKTWKTMLDDKVRDTHSYLQGLTVSIDEKFYTYDGDEALFPGDFKNPANNCGCRCMVILSES